MIVLENGIYEVTGGQQTAASAARRHAEVDFAGFARAAGFAVAERFDRLDDWQKPGRRNLDNVRVRDSSCWPSSRWAPSIISKRPVRWPSDWRDSQQALAQI